MYGDHASAMVWFFLLTNCASSVCSSLNMVQHSKIMNSQKRCNFLSTHFAKMSDFCTIFPFSEHSGISPFLKNWPLMRKISEKGRWSLFCWNRKRSCSLFVNGSLMTGSSHFISFHIFILIFFFGKLLLRYMYIFCLHSDG